MSWPSRWMCGELAWYSCCIHGSLPPFYMKVFTCNNCRNPLYFENSECLKCGHAVGFDAASLTMITLTPGQGSIFSNATNDKELYQYCRNAEFGVCNWLVPAGPEPSYCIACALNRIIPSLDNEENRLRWKNMEVAKHRLIYSLLRLHLPFEVTREGKLEAIQFDFMAETPNGEKVMTGHDNGIITINISEADEAERVRNKQDLGERYRTLLGHFRHEIGHYYWDVLVREGPAIEKYRGLFGDERQDYAAALETYYANGAPADWNQHFISPYATAHPWEDWAETWAHYLHMMDTLETAWAFGIRIDPAELEEDAGIRISSIREPYDQSEFDRLIKRWLPLCFAVNSLNRSMGHADFYPFILSVPVIEKLRFIHELCHAAAPAGKTGPIGSDAPAPAGRTDPASPPTSAIPPAPADPPA